MIFAKNIQTVDMHVDGEPLRVIVDGLPAIPGKTQLEKRHFAMQNLDDFRKLLMHEPRGHHGMYGCILTPPIDKASDFGVLFMHNEGWSTMCGHGIIAAVTMGLETGRFPLKPNGEPYIIESPAGIVKACAKLENNRVKKVACEHVPSFVYKKAQKIRIDNREVTVDVSFGGAFYVIVNSADLELTVSKPAIAELQNWASKIKSEVERRWTIVHPLEEGLNGIYGVIFSDSPKTKDADLRNVTVFAERQIDRSPCGTGTAARLASLFVHGELGVGESFKHESITDGVFEGKILSELKIGSYNGVKPIVSGTGYITGFHNFVLDPQDNLPTGFLL